MTGGMEMLGIPLVGTVTLLFGIYTEIIFFAKSKKKVHTIAKSVNKGEGAPRELKKCR